MASSSLLSKDELELFMHDGTQPQPQSQQQQQNVNETSAMSRQLRSTSRTISIGCMLVVVMSFACMLILAMIIVFSSVLAKEKKIFIGTIMGVLLLGIQVVLCVSRKEPNTLIIFSIISSFVSGLCLGLSVWYF
jgi:uncharacterized membrane protein